MSHFHSEAWLEIESASTEKLRNAASAAFCNFSIEADSINFKLKLLKENGAYSEVEAYKILLDFTHAE